MIPDNITKEDIKTALKEIDEQGISKERKSSVYNLIYEGKTYPPKLVISIANRYTNGIELDSNKFSGGQETNEFLKTKGFEISQKNDPVKTLIENYKKRISVNKLKEEMYKWELVNQYSGRPDTKATDFYQEIKSIKFGNLIYKMGMAVIQHLANDKPEELRELFKKLFDENIDLTERVKLFNEETLTIYRELEDTLPHHQDERSIATYLTFHNSNKYTFYKNSFYKKYCKLLGIKAAKRNEKYVHYLELINDLIENYIIPDEELIEQVKSLIPEYYDGTNHNILAQDILYQMLDQEAEINYWIFQGNPKVFDFETALKQDILTDWTVSAHKDKIKVGDKVILWITGDRSGCYAFAEVTSEPHSKISSPDDHLWKEKDNSELKAEINITHNLVSSPILKEQIDSIKELNSLKVGNQGTNFSASEEEFNALLKLAEKPNLFEQTKNKFDKKIFDNYIQYLQKIIRELNIQPNDERIVYSVRKDRLNFTVGQRYCFNLYYSDANGVYGVISKDKLLENSEPYNGNPPKPYYNYYQDFSPSDSDWLSIIDSIKAELARTSKSGYRKYNDLDFENYVFEYQYLDKEENMNFPLNTILYGPPGTGKTYNTILRAAEIIENRKIDSYDEALKIFKDNLHNRIEFITFHQNYSYEDFIQGLRPETDNKSTLTFDKINGVFKRISDRAKHNPYYIPIGTVLKDYKVIKSNADIVELWSDKTRSIRYVPTQLIIDLIEGIKSNKINLEDIKRRRDLDLPTLIGSKVEKYYFGIEGTLYNICEHLLENENSNKSLNYVIIIDEINRANISRVFGELITLIEPDKRSDGAIPIEARLPSGDPFIIPSNLYIIGTMNTADKSIALLDIALRRRFDFEAMYPKYEIPNQKIYDVDILQRINEQIIKTKGHDFQIGHSYFMGEDNKDLIRRINKKIIPLLLEYYMNDEKEVKNILNSAGLKIENGSWPLVIIGKND